MKPKRKNYQEEIKTYSGKCKNYRRFQDLRRREKETEEREKFKVRKEKQKDREKENIAVRKEKQKDREKESKEKSSRVTVEETERKKQG